MTFRFDLELNRYFAGTLRLKFILLTQYLRGRLAFAGHLSSSLCQLVRSETQVQLLEIHEIHDQMSYKKMKFQSFFEVEYYIIKVHRILIIC